jgi:hypothetical protein
MPRPTALGPLLSQLGDAVHVPRPEGEPWTALIARVSVPRTIAEIDEDTFFYFLEVLPPKYQASSVFAFAERAEPLRLFWRASGHCFCRQLTWEETKLFCQLTGTSFLYWH